MLALVFIFIICFLLTVQDVKLRVQESARMQDFAPFTPELRGAFRPIDLRTSHTYFIKTSKGQVCWFPDFNKEVAVLVKQAKAKQVEFDAFFKNERAKINEDAASI
jgi:hypothetical protein